MYIKVVVGDSGEDGHQATSEILVNINCPIRVIYDHIQKCFNIDCDFEFDLCDENGNLAFIYEKEPWSSGTDYLTPRATYFVIFFERDDEHRVMNPMLYIPDLFRKSATQLNELMSKIKRQINPIQNGRTSRPGKTRSSTTTLVK